MEGGTSEQRYMDVACERFRKDTIDKGIFVRTAWRTAPPSGKLPVWEVLASNYLRTKTSHLLYNKWNVTIRIGHISCSFTSQIHHWHYQSATGQTGHTYQYPADSIPLHRILHTTVLLRTPSSHNHRNRKKYLHTSTATD